MNNRRFFNFGILIMFLLNMNLFAQQTSFHAYGYPPEAEIHELLKANNLSLKEEVDAKMIFRLSDEMKVEIVQVKTPNKKVKAFILSQLKDVTLSQDGWHSNKLYELPITIRP